MEPIWVVLLGAAALFVRAGQMLGAMGIARAKNVASAGLRSVADLCVATLCFWALGAAITFQSGNPVFGINARALIGWGELSPNWFIALTGVLIATGIISPALSERSRLRVPLVIGGMLAGLLVPMVMNWTKWGWLSDLRFVDAGGAAAIHLAPAICAALGALFVGPREGKYNRDGSANMIPGHSVLMVLISVIMTIIGWAPYISMMSTAALGAKIAANVFIAVAASGVASLIVGHIRYGKSDVMLICSGILGGLVSITAAAAEVSTPGAFVIGTVAGLLIPYMAIVVELRLKLDDPGGVVVIHGIGALWALVAAGLFSEGSLVQRLRVLGVQGMGIVVVSVTTVALMLVLITILKMFGHLRSKEADEYDGLDLAEHDINAHPDFQQTMIKSYHLREA